MLDELTIYFFLQICFSVSAKNYKNNWINNNRQSNFNYNKGDIFIGPQCTKIVLSTLFLSACLFVFRPEVYSTEKQWSTNVRQEAASPVSAEHLTASFIIRTTPLAAWTRYTIDVILPAEVQLIAC